MLPSRFALHRPPSVEAAIELLDRHGEAATPFAGGTELLVAMKARALRYDHVVDLKKITSLRGVRRLADGGAMIGPLSTHRELSSDPVLAEVLPTYGALSSNIANVRVRASGTIGGNLCFAEPHADPPTYLCAADAVVHLAGPRGERALPLARFLTGEFSTARAHDEILTGIEIPPSAVTSRIAYESIGHLERPAVNVACRADDLDGQRRFRFVVGAACGRPTELPALTGQLPASDEVEAGIRIRQLAEAACDKLGDVADDLFGSADYKRHLAAVLICRTFMKIRSMEVRQ
ncbi:MAG: xanthine dehydrogenase family protein subunit M [Burkholderiaceae bacterium]